MPNMKMFLSPTSSLISTLAPSSVPMVSAPLACSDAGQEHSRYDCGRLAVIADLEDIYAQNIMVKFSTEIILVHLGQKLMTILNFAGSVHVY